MKIFLDTADITEIKELMALGIIDGITTNPSLLAKACTSGSHKTIKQHVLDICTLVAPGDVSIEVTEKEPMAVYHQAHKLAQLASNIVVKIPCDIIYYPIIKKLIEEKVRINCTLIFSVIQGLMMAKLGVDYISPFVGRLDDLNNDGLQLVADLRYMIDSYMFKKTKILAASLRHVRHIDGALLSGADVATVPCAVLKASLHHVLTDKGIAQFDADWRKLNINVFP